MRVRRAKRDQLLEEGVSPYPVRVPRTHSLAQVRSEWGDLAPGAESGAEVGVAGRVIFVRNTGKLCFATLQAGDGTQLQLMLSAAVIGPEELARWKSLVDLGDHVFAHGQVIASRRGELSVMASSWSMASKALRPLPVLHKELSEEQRVRRRYVDLIVREDARAMVRARASVMRAIREVLHARGYLEVETPTLQTTHGGANARPFTTHLNAFDLPMTLRIALELHLKRAVVGGIDRVYEIGRIFRNEGIDSSHSPEFTMLEAYEAYGDQETMAELTRDIILAAADALGSRRITYHDETIDLDAPWSWLSFYDGLSEAVGEKVTVETSGDRLHALARDRGLCFAEDLEPQKVAMEVFEALVEPEIIQPTFVCDYPAAAQPLARPHRSQPGLIEAWDLIVGGTERATAFSELIDPQIQRQRLEQQSAAAAGGDEEAMSVDEDFLQALEQGAPPMGGLGLGIDRVMMLLTGAGIRETILFPFVKPQV
jgi:lysyl-tRNA synthetase class 2